jgi:hypothetical protein
MDLEMAPVLGLWMCSAHPGMALSYAHQSLDRNRVRLLLDVSASKGLGDLEWHTAVTDFQRSGVTERNTCVLSWWLNISVIYFVYFGHCHCTTVT